MTITEHRNKLLAEIGAAPPLDERTQDLIELAGDRERIDELISVINDEGRPDDEKISAIDSLNQISVFSPVLPAKMPEFVNALRGQMNAARESIRARAFSTLTSIKDEVAQIKLLEDMASDKQESEKLLPTSKAIAMLGIDSKVMPASLLRKIAVNPPTKEALVEAVRHMAGDSESYGVLKKIMEDESSPLEARTLIPEMINKVNPQAFLNTARDLLDKGTNTELATALTRGVAEVKAFNAKSEYIEAKEAVRKMMKTSPQSFKNLANELLFDKKEDADK